MGWEVSKICCIIIHICLLNKCDKTIFKIMFLKTIILINQSINHSSQSWVAKMLSKGKSRYMCVVVVFMYIGTLFIYIKVCSSNFSWLGLATLKSRIRLN